MVAFAFFANPKWPSPNTLCSTKQPTEYALMRKLKGNRCISVSSQLTPDEELKYAVECTFESLDGYTIDELLDYATKELEIHVVATFGDRDEKQPLSRSASKELPPTPGTDLLTANQSGEVIFSALWPSSESRLVKRVNESTIIFEMASIVGMD